MPKSEHDTAAARIIEAVDSLRTFDDRATGDLWSSIVNAPKRRQDDLSTLITSLDEAVFDLFELSDDERDLVRDFWNETHDLFSKGAKSKALTASSLPVTMHGTAADLQGDFSSGDLRRYLAVFVNSWNSQLPSDIELAWQVAVSPRQVSLAVAFTPIERGAAAPPPPPGGWKAIAARAVDLEKRMSPAFKTGLTVRAASNGGFLILRRNQRRLWTSSSAHDDAQAMFLQLAAIDGVRKHG